MARREVADDDFDHFIGSWLNSDNPKYATYVQGVKLFKEYLEERDNGKS